MRLLCLAIRLYPESAAARRLVIVSLLGLFCAAAGIAALVALVYRNSPAPQFVVPLIDLLIGMERPGTLLSVVGPTLLVVGVVIFWLTLSSFRAEFLPDTDEAYRLLLLQLMAQQRERERSSVLLIGNGPLHRAVAVALARTNLDLRVLRLEGNESERAYLLALARNATALEGSLGTSAPVLTAQREPVALDELYALRARLVDYRPDEVEVSALRRLLGEPGLIAALLEDEEAGAATAACLASEGLRSYLGAARAPKLLILPTVARAGAEDLLRTLDPDHLFDTVVINAARSRLGGGPPPLPFLAFDRAALRRLGYILHEVPIADWDQPSQWNPEDVATALYAELARRLLHKVPPPRR
jgi:hypothetical protein